MRRGRGGFVSRLQEFLVSSVSARRPNYDPGVIAGAHAIIFAEDAERARAFLRDVLGFEAVDAGDGWRIFALPPAELAVHPGPGWGEGRGIMPCSSCASTSTATRLSKPFGSGNSRCRSSTSTLCGRRWMP
jgi:hypothetical protein